MQYTVYLHNNVMASQWNLGEGLNNSFTEYMNILTNNPVVFENNCCIFTSHFHKQSLSYVDFEYVESQTVWIGIIKII